VKKKKSLRGLKNFVPFSEPQLKKKIFSVKGFHVELTLATRRGLYTSWWIYRTVVQLSFAAISNVWLNLKNNNRHCEHKDEKESYHKPNSLQPYEQPFPLGSEPMT